MILFGSFFQYHQDQMSLRHKKRQQPQMLPAVQPVRNTGPGKYGYLNGPQSTSDVEAEMALEALQKIHVHKKMAILFQQYT